jgi:hypothetical protein
MPKASRKGFFAVSEAGAKLARVFESKATQKLTEIIQKIFSRIKELKNYDTN